MESVTAMVKTQAKAFDNNKINIYKQKDVAFAKTIENKRIELKNYKGKIIILRL